MWAGPLSELRSKVDKIADSKAQEEPQGSLCEYSGVGKRDRDGDNMEIRAMWW